MLTILCYSPCEPSARRCVPTYVGVVVLLLAVAHSTTPTFKTTPGRFLAKDRAYCDLTDAGDVVRCCRDPGLSMLGH